MIKKYKNIENDFFKIDEELKIAHIEIAFKSPSDIFDMNYLSKTPVFSDDFIDWIGSAFKIIPRKYKIALTVSFDDMGELTKNQMMDIFTKNIILEYKSRRSAVKKKNRIAYGLIGVGIVLFVAMIAITRLWQGESLAKEIFTYVSDIAATVTFWEALTILVVEAHEERSYAAGLIKRFDSIEFCKTGDEKNEAES